MAGDVKKINREFYNEVYSSKNVLFGLLHSLFSYDQQSKSWRNFREIKSAIKVLGPEGKIRFLDYGFGHGSLLLKMPKNVSAFGCDIAEEAVITFERIARTLKRDIKVTTVENFEAAAGSLKFDVISCSHVLEHVEDDNKLVSEFEQLLTPKGILLINLPINEVWVDPKHVRTYTRESASALLEAHHFKIIKVSEEDKMTSFFLSHEQASLNTNKLIRIFFRILRLLYRVIPKQLERPVEKILPAEYKNQQLIIVAVKNG